jgi:hypothetical protein
LVPIKPIFYGQKHLQTLTNTWKYLEIPGNNKMISQQGDGKVSIDMQI